MPPGTSGGKRLRLMPNFSTEFNLEKTQPELDFVDISLSTDNRLFVDPFALSQKADR